MRATARVGALWDRSQSRVIASDPGGERLLLALRATLAVAAAGAVIAGLAALLGESFAGGVAGLLVAMLGSIAIRDPEPARERVTLALAPLPAAAALSAAALLAGHALAGQAALVVLAFVVVWVRRFGGRGTALGMLAFIGFFLGLFLRVAPAQLPWAWLAIVSGAATAGLVRFVVLRDRPRRQVPRILRAFRARAAEVAEAAIRAAGVQDRDDRRRRRLRRRLLALAQTAAAVDVQLEEDHAGYGPASEALRQRVFDATLTAEELGSAARARPSRAGDLPAVRAALGALAQDEPARARSIVAAAGDGADTTGLLDGLMRLAEVLEGVRPPPPDAREQAPADGDGDGDGDRTGTGRRLA